MPAEQPPPSSTLPGKSSSSGPYLAGIIVLALLAIGLFVWKTQQSTPTVTTQSATAMTTSAAPPPPPPPLYAPPPPPKLDEEEDAGADAGKTVAKGNGTGGPASGPCGGKCAGTSTPALDAKLRGAAQSSQGCYTRALRTSEASGSFTVSVQISSTGSVCGASITNDQVHSTEISSCVLGKFRATQFPTPAGGCVTANIPISFKIKQ